MDTERLYVKQAGSGAPLLLIHGLLMNGDMFEPIVGGFANKHLVLIPDLRGFGRSGHLAPPYTVEQHAQDLAQWLKSWSVSSTVVLGYSQGGVIAQQLALDYPEFVSHLILCCTFAYNRSSWQEKIEGLIVPWLVRLLSARQLAQMAKGLKAEQAKQIEAMIASNRKSRMVDAAKIMLKFDSRPRLKDIKCPTLVVAGAADTAVPLHHARMLAREIPEARLRIIPHAGHEMIWSHGAELSDAIKSFLGEAL